MKIRFTTTKKTKTKKQCLQNLEKAFQARIIYPAKLVIMSVCRIKTFSEMSFSVYSSSSILHSHQKYIKFQLFCIFSIAEINSLLNFGNLNFKKYKLSARQLRIAENSYNKQQITRIYASTQNEEIKDSEFRKKWIHHKKMVKDIPWMIMENPQTRAS